jgi:ATP-dependent DNA helicase DinG
LPGARCRSPSPYDSRSVGSGSEGVILVRTRTFWEGVEVAGPSVSMVVMDRVPFAPPDDPVAAKLREKAFREVFLPKAQVAVRQGAGRLMRRAADRGVVALLDPRMVGKGWGKAVLNSLPPGVPARSRRWRGFSPRTPAARAVR